MKNVFYKIRVKIASFICPELQTKINSLEMDLLVTKFSLGMSQVYAEIYEKKIDEITKTIKSIYEKLKEHGIAI